MWAKTQGRKDGNNTPSYDTRDTLDYSPDLHAQALNHQCSVDSVANFDILKDYLSSQGQQEQINHLLDSLKMLNNIEQQDATALDGMNKQTELANSAQCNNDDVR